MSEIGHIVQQLNRRTGHVTPMQCPYLIVKGGARICQRMAEAALDGNLSDFDLQHYCCGNPANCFYFRQSKVLARTV